MFNIFIIMYIFRSRTKEGKDKSQEPANGAQGKKESNVPA